MNVRDAVVLKKIIQYADETKEMYNGVSWKELRTLRNVAAHSYGSFSDKLLWKTVSEVVPALRVYCEGILSESEGEVNNG